MHTIQCETGVSLSVCAKDCDLYRDCMHKVIEEHEQSEENGQALLHNVKVQFVGVHVLWLQ